MAEYGPVSYNDDYFLQEEIAMIQIISGVKGKGKTKIVSTISRKKAKKAVRTITTKSKAKQYVKIHSYVIVNGKKVYSNWSKARRI